ncbi:MAG: MBL fold metallo-hydrolase [Gemmatimonadota bacterium]|nr:MBL fold metallo-hydrolase [Gemmatimonadota bacterium]
MLRRDFIALSGVSLAASCSSPEPEAAPQAKATAGKGPEGRFYPPVTQTSPPGYKVIHDRSTYIEQYKYDNWEPGRSWKDDSELFADLSYQWASGNLPIQRRPMEILENLYLLGPEDYHQCIYLWDTGSGLLLIDPSYSRFRPMVETQVRQLGYELGDVKWVLLTHMHRDHAQSAGAWEQAADAAVYIHADDVDYITGRKKVYGSEIDQPVKNPQTFTDGDDLAFGNVKMKVIHTPGHTPGSSCFYLSLPGNKVLISGDIVLNWGRHAWMGADYCNWDQYLESLWKLNEMNVVQAWNVLLPGHGTIDLEGAGNSLYAVIQVVSEIIRRRRAGSDIDWIDPYKLFWTRKAEGKGEIEPLRS